MNKSYMQRLSREETGTTSESVAFEPVDAGPMDGGRLALHDEQPANQKPTAENAKQDWNFIEFLSFTFSACVSCAVA